MRKIHRGGTLVREYEYDLGAYKTGMRRTDRLADGTMRVREIVADRYGNPVRIMDGAGQTLITYTYNDKRQLVKVRDETTERETAFTYNAYTGEVTSVTEDGVTVAEKFDYGKRLASRTQWEDNKTEEYGYTYDDALKNRLTKITKNGGEWKTFSYDGFDRMTEERTALDGDGAYEKVTAYRADGTINRTEHTTPLYAYEESYGFDQSGNITGIYTDRGDVRYTYDAYGRLITEENERLGKTWKYGYDSRGNITYKEETDSGTGSGERRVYEYEPYTDRLKRIRKYRETGYYTGPSVLNRGAAGAGTPGGKTSMETWYLGGFAGLSLTPGPEWYQYGEEEYGTDSAGNALQFRSNVVEWDNRRLKKYGDVNYTYDGYGKRRSKKKEGEEEHTYEWLGEELKTERYGTHTLRYEYGVNGVTEIELDGERYIYVRNGQGDVVGILDGSGRLTAEYLYDAWGNHEVKCYDAEGEPVTDEAAIRNHIGRINPIRYRGYYYDEETELYYLESRYYSAAVGRFVSADDVEYLAPGEHQGFNLYAYCGNNPVMYVDPSGHFIISFLLAGLVAGAIIGGTVGGVAAYDLAVETGASGWELFGWTVLGVLGGAVIGGAIGAGVGAGMGAMASGVSALGSWLGGGGLAIAGGGTVGGGLAVAGASVGTAVEVGAGIGAIGAGLALMSKPNSGRIRYSDGIGKNPDGSKMSPSQAETAYKNSKDPIYRAKLKKWMKGQKYRHSHLKGVGPLFWLWLYRFFGLDS